MLKKRKEEDPVVEIKIEQEFEPKPKKSKGGTPVAQVRFPAGAVFETSNRSISAAANQAVRLKAEELAGLHGSKSGELRIINGETGEAITEWTSISANFDELVSLVRGDKS